MTSTQYVLICGQGRSGTNCLLDLLDFSPHTHCRNEPDALVGSPFSLLPDPTLQQPYGDSFGPAWDQAIATAAMQMGERDRIGVNPKHYFRAYARHGGGTYLMRGRRRRQIAAALTPGLAEEQWAAPAWLVKQRLLKQACPIFKLNQIPGWAAWVMPNRPQSTTIQIVRHPGGFINSWRNRYVSDRNIEEIRQDCYSRLQALVAASPTWARRIGSIEAMSIDELELWYWRYANEVVYQAGQGCANHLRVIYEDLVRDPIAVMKLVYETCGLPWSEHIAQGIAQNMAGSQAIAMAWQKQLSPPLAQLTESILADSPLAGLWQGATASVGQAGT
ncbi:MAG: sulfotransferase [Elainellaceae cyanobacterium]